MNDKIAVGGNLSLAGSTAVNVTPVNGYLGGGTYTLLTYGGSLTSGNATNLALNLSNTPRQTYSLSTSTANEVNLIVTGDVADLTWTGAQNNNWVDGQADPISINWTGRDGWIARQSFLQQRQGDVRQHWYNHAGDFNFCYCWGRQHHNWVGS